MTTQATVTKITIHCPEKDVDVEADWRTVWVDSEHCDCCGTTVTLWVSCPACGHDHTIERF